MPRVKKPRSTAAYQHSRNGLREAILGLLAIRPMSGYDLSRSYKHALQQIWYAPLGQVYPTLRKMQQQGLLRVTITVQKERPNRKVYRLTAVGRRYLVMWLLQPATLPSMHHEFIHKLFLLSRVRAGSRLKLIESYVEKCTAWSAELHETERQLERSLKGPNAESAWFQLQSLRHLCRIVECEADSARQIAAEIRVGASAKPRSASVPSVTDPLKIPLFAGISLSPVGGAASAKRTGRP